jgi:hypothetical protein
MPVILVKRVVEQKNGKMGAEEEERYMGSLTPHPTRSSHT